MLLADWPIVHYIFLVTNITNVKFCWISWDIFIIIIIVIIIIAIIIIIITIVIINITTAFYSLSISVECWEWNVAIIMLFTNLQLAEI